MGFVFWNEYLVALLALLQCNWHAQENRFRLTQSDVEMDDFCGSQSVNLKQGY